MAVPTGAGLVAPVAAVISTMMRFPLTVSMTIILKTRSLKMYFYTGFSLDVPLLASNLYGIFISIL